MLIGVDVSSHQAITGGWGDFVVSKASEGLTYVNPKHAGQVAAARAAGRLVGHYHYGHDNDPTAEVDAFLAAANPRPGELLALDMEWPWPGADMAARAAWSAQFLTALQAAGLGATPLLYVNGYWADQMCAREPRLRQWPLWIAQYSARGNPALHGWPSWTMHQYSGSPIDLDVFNGDKAAWASLAVGGTHGGGRTGAPIPTTTTGMDWTDMATLDELRAVVSQEATKALRAEGVSGAGDLGRLTTALEPPVRKWVSEEATKALRAEGVSGAADLGRLTAALVPALVAALPAGSAPTAAELESALKSAFAALGK